MTTAEVIVFPDVQALLCDYLREGLLAHGYDVFVGSKVPTDRPDEFVTVQVTGGFRRSVKIDVPSVVVDSWGGSEQGASDLAEVVRGLIFALDRYQGTQVYDVSEGRRPVNLPDPKSSHERFSATYSIPVSGYAL